MTGEEAKKALEAIRDGYRKIYYGGLKGEGTLDVINEGYNKTFELDGFINQSNTTPAEPAKDATATDA